MTEPIPGQVALFPDLAADVPEFDPLQTARTGANGASHVTDGLNEKGIPAAAHVDQVQPWGLADVPDALRVFADVLPGRDAWRAWTADTAPAHAALEYRQRLGTWPAAVIRNPRGGAVLAGPVTLAR